MISILRTRLLENNKFTILLLLTIVVGVIMYGNLLNLPYFLLALIFLIASILIFVLPKKIELATFSIIIVLGFFSSFASPIHDIPDETVHFARSMFLSEGNMNLSNDELKLLIDDDILKFESIHGKPLLYHLSLTDNSSKKIPYKPINNTNGYYIFSYIPQSLGIALGKLMRLPLSYYYLLGRFFNVIAYALLIYVALKILPVGKQVISVTSLFPMNLYLSASYNQDSVSLGLIILITSMFIRMLTIDRDIKLIDIGIYTMLCSIVVFTKIPYIIFILLLLFIPSSRFKNSRISIILYKFGAVVIVIGVTLFWLKTYSQIKSPQIDSSDFLKLVNPREQLLNFVDDPIKYGQVLLRDSILHLIKPEGILVLGPLTYGISEFFTISILYLFTIVANNANSFSISRFSRFGMLFISLGVLVGITLTLYLTYTPVGLTNILGVQDRYFLGILPLFLLLLVSDNKYLERCRGILTDSQVLNISIIFIVFMLVRILLQYYI